MTAPGNDASARLALAMTQAAESLRAAMHAIHDIEAAGTRPGYWYDRTGELYWITNRASDLLAAIGDLVGGLPAEDLCATDGTNVADLIDSTHLKLRKASADVHRAKLHVNRAWADMSVVTRRTDGGRS